MVTTTVCSAVVSMTVYGGQPIKKAYFDLSDFSVSKILSPTILRQSVNKNATIPNDLDQRLFEA